jgi:hypothetical protein
VAIVADPTSRRTPRSAVTRPSLSAFSVSSRTIRALTFAWVAIMDDAGTMTHMSRSPSPQGRQPDGQSTEAPDARAREPLPVFRPSPIRTMRSCGSSWNVSWRPYEAGQVDVSGAILDAAVHAWYEGHIKGEDACPVATIGASCRNRIREAGFLREPPQSRGTAHTCRCRSPSAGRFCASASVIEGRADVQFSESNGIPSARRPSALCPCARSRPSRILP